MFHTFSEAEFPIPAGLAPRGAKSWRWIELSMQAPYFLIAISQESEGITYTKHLICAVIDEVIAFNDGDSIESTLESVSVLCPGYMTDSSVYRTEEIAEVWMKKGRPREQVFITKDGRKLRFSLYCDPAPDAEMECVLRMRPAA